MMNSRRISLNISESTSQTNRDSLSLLSIASVLREGLVIDENDSNQTVIKKSDNQINGQELVDISIEDTLKDMSNLSLKTKSETLSTIGNKYANSGQYSDAIRYYSKAISLYDDDYRLYCNRSYCYERLMKYEDSLADALRSVILMPEKPKPYFRQGKALIGLKKYSDAEKAFNKILEIEPNCEDTKKEMMKTRYLALRDYGLSIEDASIAAINHKTIDEALEASLTRNTNTTQTESHLIPSIEYRSEYPFISRPITRFGSYKRSQSRPPTRVSNFTNFNTSTNTNALKRSLSQRRSHSVDNLFGFKSCDQLSTNRTPKRRDFRQNCNKEYRLPKNLFGYKGLWIGNVSPNCKVMRLRSIFSKYGSVDYVNVVGTSFCAFVNYHNFNSPRIAIANLYGQVIQGVSNGDRPLVFRFIPGNDQKDLHYMRPYQPKGTNECYFWRTTGCKDFNCPLLHYPVCKGIDFQPWMAKKNKFVSI